MLIDKHKQENLHQTGNTSIRKPNLLCELEKQIKGCK